MISPIDEIYEFVFRGLLTEESLDRAGRDSTFRDGPFDQDLASTLSTDLLDDDLVAEAGRMAAVYTVVAAFENSARQLVSSTLIAEFGENWWEEGVGQKVRSRAETKRAEEQNHRWHAARGGDLINYTLLGDLIPIIRKNEIIFKPYVPSIEWAQSIFDVIERSRNVIMHSGVLPLPDIERLGINIRDWVKQVGA